MSEKIEDGGPAFPIVSTETNEHGFSFPCVETGMSLRDWFAGRALAAIIAADGAQYFMEPHRHAEIAYAHADAMLRVRKGSQS